MGQEMEEDYKIGCAAGVSIAMKIVGKYMIKMKSINVMKNKVVIMRNP